MKSRIKHILGVIISFALLFMFTACGDLDKDESYESTYDSNDTYDYNDSYNSNDTYRNDDSYGEGLGYNPNDPYYSENDHNHDGKLTDEEWQDAMGDAIDDMYDSMY